MTRPSDQAPAFPLPYRLPAQFTLSDSEFRTISKLVYQRFGINLTEQKRTLVVGRLQKILRQKEFKGFAEYLEYLRTDSSGRALGELVDRISTNHTFFFRESKHFEFLMQSGLGQVVHSKEPGDRDLRIWCAGCSSGEEAYSLMMVMLEYFGPQYGAWDAGLLATDISSEALAVASKGIYGGDRLASLPEPYKNRYFMRSGPDLWCVKERLRREVTFRRFNLMNRSFPFKRPFDIIFCRNVMIYFDQPTREALVRRLYDFTAPGGYLFIGHSESLGRDTCPYDYVMPALYHKRR